MGLLADPDRALAILDRERRRPAVFRIRREQESVKGSVDISNRPREGHRGVRRAASAGKDKAGGTAQSERPGAYAQRNGQCASVGIRHRNSIAIPSAEDQVSVLVNALKPRNTVHRRKVIVGIFES